jgi:hypothetical protein
MMIMAGPAPKVRKLGRTPSQAGDWRDYDDVPFEGAPPMPKPHGRKKTWHPLVEAWWNSTSKLPHAKDWRDDDWLKVYEVMEEKQAYYTTTADLRKTTQLTEIRRREDALGVGDQARRQLRIRYLPVLEDDVEDEVDQRQVAVSEDSATGAKPGKVLSLADRRNALAG